MVRAMQNREIILKKIDVQKQEWENQVKYLESMILSFNGKKRLELEKYINHLNSKLENIDIQILKLKMANPYVWDKYASDIAKCWEELVHNVDYVIAGYIKIFNQ